MEDLLSRVGITEAIFEYVRRRMEKQMVDMDILIGFFSRPHLVPIRFLTPTLRIR